MLTLRGQRSSLPFPLIPGPMQLPPQAVPGTYPFGIHQEPSKEIVFLSSGSHSSEWSNPGRGLWLSLIYSWSVWHPGDNFDRNSHLQWQWDSLVRSGLYLQVDSVEIEWNRKTLNWSYVVRPWIGHPRGWLGVQKTPTPMEYTSIPWGEEKIVSPVH